MEVSFGSGETSSEVVPVSFETVVTETGMLQLWCVARDGRRWKLEFNVREKSASVNESRHRPRHHELRPRLHRRTRGRRPPIFRRIHIFEIAATGRRRTRRAAPHAAVVPVSGGRTNRSASTRASRARWCPTRLVHSAKSWLSNPDVDRTAKILPWDSQESRTRALAGRSLGALHRAISRRVGQGEGRSAARASRTSSSPCPRRSTKKRAN